MRLVNILGADSVQHPEHGPAEAGPDGVFELDETFGAALLAHPAQWRTEADHIAQVSRKALEELADPQRAAEVLHFVHGRVRALEAELAELPALRAELAGLREEMDGRVTELEDKTAAAESTPEPTPEPTPAEPTPAKTAKAAKATSSEQ